jgi:hypothetical protein
MKILRYMKILKRHVLFYKKITLNKLNINQKIRLLCQEHNHVKIQNTLHGL